MRCLPRSNVKVCFISLKNGRFYFRQKKNMNTNNNILDDIDDREDMDEDELLRQQQNTWTMCIEHDGGGARRDVHPPPPRLIPLSSISKEGIEASEIRMKMMKYEADTTKPFSPPPPQRNNGTMGVAVQSVSKSVGTQTTTDDVDDEEMFDTNGAEQQHSMSLGLRNDESALPKKKPKVMRTAKTTRILDDDDSSGDDGEEVQTVKNEKEKKSSSSGTRCDDKKGHCGFGVPGFVEKQPQMLSSRLQNPSNNPEQREEKQQHQCKKSSDNATTTIEDQEGELAVVPKHNHRELNALVDYNRNGRATNNANRRDQFTSFVSNPDNTKLLKRICIKAGNNARFFLSKVSKSFKKVTLRDFGVMSSSNLEQGRVKAVKISEIETPAQFALCIEHGLQLNDLVFAALADGGRLEVLKYIHDHLLPDKMYLNSLAVEYASQNNHLQTLQYLVEYHNAPLCKDACWRAAWKGSFECLQYLVLERKCPFDRHECHEIAYQSGHFDLARWIKEH